MPNQINGKIVTKNRGLPIQDLLIVAYDLDPDGGSKNHENVAALWDRLQADRLGSTLSAADGTFSLSFADDLFRHGQQSERRPDLILIVLAPDDARDGTEEGGAAHSTSWITHPGERVLHVSSAIRAGAGRSEAYIVRIPESRLEKLGIHPGRPLGDPEELQELDASEVVRAVTRKVEFERRLATDPDIEKALKGPRASARERVVAARLLVDRLTSPPPDANRSYFARTESERPELMKQAMDARLGTLNGTGGRFRVQVSEEQADALSQGATAQAVLSQTSSPLDRVRVRSLLDACRARQACRELHRAPSVPPDAGERGVPDDGGDPGHAGEGPGERPDSLLMTPEEAQAEIRSRILGQIAPLSTFVPDGVGQRQDPLQLQDTLDALKLRGGPADEVAFHDFHTLQIAFRSVWAQSVDGDLRADMEAMYDDWVRVRRFSGEPELQPDDLDEFTSLTDFLRKVRGDLSAARGLAERTGSDPTWEGNPGRRISVRRAAERAVGNAKSEVAKSVEGAARDNADRTAGVSGGRTNVRRPEDDDNLLVRLGRLMSGIENRLREPYAFDLFAKDTVNFGLMVTYRQRWQPEAYQVGELVSTIPLAPSEKRTISVKQVVKKSRAETEAESALNSLKAEASQTSRADKEIVRKASTSTNFKQTANANFSMGEFLDVGGTSEFTTNQARESEDRKKSFREAVRKSAEEYRNERKMEVKSTEETSLEETRSGEIVNPNNEITVTYLFYELQRRYRVSEELYRVRPVVMVAADVPAPDEIDEDWLLTHEWILRRVMLDDSLQQALDYLRSSIAGDEFAVEVLRATWQRNLFVVERLASQLDDRSALRDRVRTRVVDLLSKVQRDETSQDVATAIFSGGMSLLFGGGNDDGTSLEATRDAADRELEFSESEFQEVEARLRQATSSLESSTDKYVTALRTQLNRRVAVDQLRVHVKENILHYMQAIWSHEPPDQRFFRLYRVPVPWFELTPTAIAEIRSEPPPPAPRTSSELTRLLLGDVIPFRPEIFVDIDFGRAEETRPLVEVADLDNLLGFKGNYLIFPLKESNPVVDHMMSEYAVDDALGVLDPDEYGNFTTEELEKLIQCVQEDELLEDVERDAIRELLCERLALARKDVERIIVPTGQLFVETLPGRHPVLEDFKLIHRAVDMKKAEAEWRALELENLRRAGRLIDEDRSDPEIDRQVIVQGTDDVIVDS